MRLFERGAVTAAIMALALGAQGAIAQQPSTDQRIESLQEQIKGLKVTIGALESLLRSKPGVTLPQEEVQAPRAVSGTEAPSELESRIDALETQVSALTSQIEQFNKQLVGLQARAEAPPAPQQLPANEALRPLRDDEEKAAVPAPAETMTASSAETDTDSVKSILPAKPDDAATESGTLPSDEAAEGVMQGSGSKQTSLAGYPAANAATLYNEGYGNLLRRDYDAAEIAFRRLIESHPNDKLAGDAQYWLGESYYVRGQYKDAADAFLKGYKSYSSNPKAPDSLLKLGMSLAALGQKEAACTSFAELDTKFPSAPPHVREEAKAEGRNAGC
jgi:tol-pal system protein YbgF